MIDPYCNAPRATRAQVALVSAGLLLLSLALGLSAWVVVRNQYEPFFLREGQWECKAYKYGVVPPVTDDAVCTRYDLVPSITKAPR